MANALLSYLVKFSVSFENGEAIMEITYKIGLLQCYICKLSKEVERERENLFQLEVDYLE